MLFGANGLLLLNNIIFYITLYCLTLYILLCGKTDTGVLSWYGPCVERREGRVCGDLEYGLTYPDSHEPALFNLHSHSLASPHPPATLQGAPARREPRPDGGRRGRGAVHRARAL